MAATADDLPTYADCVVSINGDRNNITTSNKKKDRPDNFYGRYQKKLPSSADNDGVCGKCCRTAPITLDILLLMFVLTPCSVIFWVVTWEMANRFKYRLYELSVILSAILFVFFHVAQPVIYKTVRRLYGGKRMFWFYIISRAYLYVFSTSGVIFWTFCWEEGVEKIPGINGHPYVTAFSSLAGFAVLRCMKCLPNISGGIGGASEEKTAEDVFLFPNLCNVQVYKTSSLFTFFLFRTTNLHRSFCLSFLAFSTNNLIIVFFFFCFSLLTTTRSIKRKIMFIIRRNSSSQDFVD